MFDTNVVLDVLAERHPFYEDSVRAWSLVETGQAEGCVSAITVPNLYYVLRREGGRQAAQSGVRFVLRVFNVVPCDERLMRDALESDFPDFEDAVQYFSALRARADCIVTRNAGHFGKSRIPVLSPGKFLDRYS